MFLIYLKGIRYILVAIPHIYWGDVGEMHNFVEDPMLVSRDIMETGFDLLGYFIITLEYYEECEHNLSNKTHYYLYKWFLMLQYESIKVFKVC